MAAKSKRKPKHVPQRTCVGCREVMPKRNLIRLVRTEQGVLVDPTGKLAGRGAYLHDVKSCWVKGLKGPLANALRTGLTEQDMVALSAYMDTLPTETEKSGVSADSESVR
ncbi:MAG TPA: YlxR family protein [Anaerolineaceae bacterium]|nr:YlxR family protein [Anaerolineaceae bacterium]HPS32471.1 YlxR family protein [Anaerolineaceae bacterium]